MADRTVAIHYVATGVARAAAAPNIVADAHVRAFQKINAAAMTKMQSTSRAVASVAAIAGKAILFGVGAALAVGAKAAVDFESSMAGVFKTLGDTASATEILALGEALRAMSLDIPVNVNELAFIAELGGQLGVGIGDMEHFTKTIAALGTTTNLSTADAAKGLARLSNIMQLPIADVDKLGNVIVDLGNKYATTESEILNFALRLAPIGQTIGATADEILAIAAAFSSLGIPAERGGTAIQRIFIDIGRAVDEGGHKLAQFADVAGMTSDAFAELSAVDQFEAFVTGLGDIQEAGGSAFSVLDRLNISQQRTIQVLLAAAGAGDIFTRALDDAAGAAEDNNALWEEAARRWGTTSSQIRLMVNAFNDLRIEIGQGLVPVIGTLMGFFRDFFTALKDNIDVVKQFAAVLITLVIAKGMIGLGNALSAAIIGLKKFWEALQLVKAGSGTVVNAISGATAGLGALTFALGLAVVGFMAFFAWQARNAGKAREVQAAVKELNDEIDRGTSITKAFRDKIIDDLLGRGDLLDFFHDAGVFAGTIADAVSEVDPTKYNELKQHLIDFKEEARDAVPFGGDEQEETYRRAERQLKSALDFIDEQRVIGLDRDEDAERRRTDLLEGGAARRKQIRLKEIIDASNARDSGGPVALHPLDELFNTKDGPTQLLDFADDVDKAFLDMNQNIADHFADTRQQIRDSIVIWGEYPKAVKINVDKVLDILAKQALDLANWNSTLATIIGMGASQSIIEMFNGFDNATKAGITHLLATNPAEFARMVEGFETEWENIDAAALINANLTVPAQSEMNNFVNTVMTQAAALGGEDMILGAELFKSGILTKFDEVGTEGKRAIINSIQALGDAGVFMAMFGVGEEFWRGLIRGMESGTESVATAARRLAHGAVNAVDDRFEVDSPSKVMIRTGMQVAAGLSAGISKGLGIDMRALDNHIGSFRQAAFGPNSTSTSNTSSVMNRYDLQVNGSTNTGGDASAILLTAQLAGAMV